MKWYARLNTYIKEQFPASYAVLKSARQVPARAILSSAFIIFVNWEIDKSKKATDDVISWTTYYAYEDHN